LSLQCPPRYPVSSRAAPWLAGALCVLMGLHWPAAHSAADYPLLGKHAPDFALRALAGANVRLSEHTGDVIVISFWSSRCASCWAQLESLDRSLATYHAVGVQMYGINVDDDQGRVRATALRAEGLAFALLLDPTKAVSRSYGVDNLPMTVLIDRGGTIRYVLRDYSAKGEALYLQQLRSLLDE
jgi:peroxiredoxin